MKKIIIVLLMAAGTQHGFAQADTTRKAETAHTSDTIRVGSIIIINQAGGSQSVDVQGKNNTHYENHWNWNWDRKKHHLENISTNWIIIDVGFSGFNDKTNYAGAEAQAFLRNPQGVPLNSGDFSYRSTTISNFDLWLFMQKLNIYKHVVNLKYGFGIQNNDYFYKTDITYVDGANPYVIRANKQFSKNKLSADFFTVPVMLNITTNPYKRYGGFQISFGVSAGYMYSARQKQRSGEMGTQRTKTNFNLDPWRINYVAEVGIGPVKVYGSYGITNVHKNSLEQVPYTVGMRFSSW
jgi:hypothetical protein